MHLIRNLMRSIMHYLCLTGRKQTRLQINTLYSCKNVFLLTVVTLIWTLLDLK